MTELRNGQIWRHKKRGGEYEIVATDGAIQVSSLEDDGCVGRVIADFLEEQVWIVYRPVNGHRLFFRVNHEFLDGRFELVKEAK